MNRRLAGLALCLSIAALPQVAMADNDKGRGAEMRDVIRGEQMRTEAGRSGDVRRDGPQRERREASAQEREYDKAERNYEKAERKRDRENDKRYEERARENDKAREERMRESRKAWEERERERNKN